MSKTPKTPKETPAAAAPATAPAPVVIVPSRPAKPAEVERWKFVKEKFSRKLSEAAAVVAHRKEMLALAVSKNKPAEVERLKRVLGFAEASLAELTLFYDRKLEIIAAEIGGTLEETATGWIVKG